MKKLIYIAAPLSVGNVAHNIRKVLETAETLIETGDIVPFIPHLSHFWNCMIPHADTRHKESFWMAYDFDMLLHCDGMIRLPGESIGADMEVEFCKEHGIRIYTLQELLRQG